ncbi:hypothetical protein HOV53_gp033 [Escherichia phage vB_EcoM_Schickermooser]|uniref:DUF7202 domain-containing protein n=1 Tax=Escherichia phage vB_EcoM_Schickermooser TaxID=2508195 RepID=A0A482N2D8_9CAUD|nr:hypothetical protein HOV53_gp033 [Escherichia phage vB_EcoM_Schickermooser]QBQ80186.1 hypothetical protein Schickermooser_00033 [Escherichia phage vB_EcoM_Schickermooser]
MKVHYPHPFDPKKKAVILRQWQRVCRTKCPINSPHNVDKDYLGHLLNTLHRKTSVNNMSRNTA